MFRRIHTVWLAVLLVLASATPARAAPVWADKLYAACATGAVTSHALVADNVDGYLFKLGGWARPCQAVPPSTYYFGVLTFDEWRGYGVPTVSYVTGDAPTDYTVEARPLARSSRDWAMVKALCVSHGPSRNNLACFAVSVDAVGVPSLISVPVDDPLVLKPWSSSPATGPDCGLCA
ncbi:hypothetical protein [Catellatospora methionotrophica]|uniref:hypothetical protein n=1 Tax=Catellatospora methionotrophica TaxID=121620 RepID=UPI0033FFEF0B